jgi:DNA ligase-1
MSALTKPMLADPLENMASVKWPVMGSPKLDGIRCLRVRGATVSRKFLTIPNNHVQKVMANLPDGLDGELVVPGKTFNQIQSAIMSEDGEPNFEFWVFDYVSGSVTKPYDERMAELAALALPAYCTKLLPVELKNELEFNAYEEECLAAGYEGIMIRAPKGRYKCGRSTEREGLLLKVKRFKDSEAIVEGFEEQNENTNEAGKDAFGRTKRSKHLAGMVGKDTLGKFLVREVGDTPWKGKEFAIGTGEGLTAELRQAIWNNRDKYLGKIVTYKYQPHGVKDLPRLPIWKGFRDPKDMS